MKCSDIYCNKEATHSYKLKKKDKTLYFCDDHWGFASGIIMVAKTIKDEKIDVV
jgi:hypothetical protein